MSNSVVGIIAEYNPFHNGHAWHLARIREALPGTSVVCVMSGQITQRGELSVCRKQARAAMAVRGGADLALELPAPYACAAAERFARAGVFLLAATGLITHLSFGSETGDLASLRRAADTLDDPAFLPLQNAALGRGLSYPAARQAALEALSPEAAHVLSGPNDVLGVEYLRALRHFHSDITLLVVPRQGATHDAVTPKGAFAPASLIRARLLGGQNIADLVPETTRALWETERAAGRAPVSLQNCEQAVLAVLRRMEPADFKALPDVSEGLENRLVQAARNAVSLDDLYARVKTKRYTHARIRRIVLRAWLNLPDAFDTPPYLRVLAANATGLTLLHKMKNVMRARTETHDVSLNHLSCRDITNIAALPILTKPASVKKMGKAALDCFESEARVTDLYALCYPDRAQWGGGQEWRTQAPIVTPAPTSTPASTTRTPPA